jgi:hypothetical protein
LGRIAYYFLNDRATGGFEVAVDAGYRNRFAGVVELGTAKEKRASEQYEYMQSGWYTRLGIDKNVLKGGDDAIFFGLRYALSNFNYEFSSLTVVDTLWGTYSARVPKTNVTAHWLEGVAGMKGLVFKNFYLGYTIRVKLKIADNGYGDVESTTIPGFGKTGITTAVGMSYYVAYRFPLKQKSIKPTEGR